MGRIVTPKYRVEMYSGQSCYTSAWDVTSRGMIKGKGKPTVANLRRQIEVLEASTGPDGVNKHLGPMKITEAYIVHQKSGEIVAEWSTPCSPHPPRP